MALFSLILYITFNLWMCFHFLFIRKERGYEYPFWAGMIALIFVVPQAVAFYSMQDELPENGYWYTLLFASACTLALWRGFTSAARSAKPAGRLLNLSLNLQSCQIAAAFFTIVGIAFYIAFNFSGKQTNEVGNLTGSATILIFFAQLMKFGFCLSLYLSLKYKFKLSLVLTLLSSIVFLIAIVFYGRRNDTAQFSLAILLTLWFVRGKAFPRWGFVAMIAAGFIGINAVGAYRRIVVQGDDANIWEQIREVDWYDVAMETFRDGGGRAFENCVYAICAADEYPFFDLGTSHWNLLIFSYYPAQLLGGIETKLAFCFPGSYPKPYPRTVVYPRYRGLSGSMQLGYADAYQSFCWFGVLLFWLCGWIMGRFYQFAKRGNMLACVMYIWLISPALHVVPAFTAVLLSLPWIFFFTLVYPILHCCRDQAKRGALCVK